MKLLFCFLLSAATLASAASLAEAANNASAGDWGYESTKNTEKSKATIKQVRSSSIKGAGSSGQPVKGRNPASGFGTWHPHASEPAAQSESVPARTADPSGAQASSGVSELTAVPAGSLEDVLQKEGKIKSQETPQKKVVPGATGGKAISPKNAGKSHSSHPPVAHNTTEAVKDWLALFALVSKEALTDDQKSEITKALQHKLSTERAQDVSDVQDFWPQVEQQISDNPDLKEPYAALFRALLRFQSHMKNAVAQDVSAINLVLGPERIAVPGDPQLTEEAIDAYADMACFLYEQAHPGKTVDAVDNRTVMAAVISDRFKDAPTAADKRAVANFAVTWTKFKILWAISGESERQKLLGQITGGKSGSPGKVRNLLIDTIFTHGPWK